MNIQVAQEGDITVVQLDGRLDGTTSSGVEQQLLNLVDGSARRMVLDLGSLTYISSVGLRVLLLVAKRLKPLNGKVVLCNMRESIREVFDIAGFANLFNVYSSREEAVKSLH